jgi:hypothetical protein
MYGAIVLSFGVGLGIANTIAGAGGDSFVSGWAVGSCFVGAYICMMDYLG